MTEAPSAFWNFSIGFYARPGVAAACLELQDEAGADINVVLYLFFLASQNRALDRTAVAQLDAAAASWRERIVQPLRAVRRYLKNAAAPFDSAAAGRLREEIKRSELAAEHIQQITIERLFPPANFGRAAASPAAAVRASLEAYAEVIGALPPAATACLIELFNA